MQNRKTFAWNMTRVTMLSLLLVAISWSQTPKELPSAGPTLPADVPGAADRYAVMLMGNPAGQQAVWTAPDGTLHIFYQFNDRGRGPKTTSILKLDAKGLPISETVEGNDYLKSGVHETYTLESGTARWKSALEASEKKLTAPAVYIPVSGAPAELGILAQAALRNGGHVDLLPEGEARIHRLAQLDIGTGGKKKHVTMYAINGLDFSPTYIWLDDRDAFFATVDPWSTVIPEGWEATVETLQAAQDQAANVRAAELAGKLGHRVPNGIVFTHADLFDAQSAQILKDQSVVVAAKRIRAVGPSGTVAIPTGAEIVDAAHKTLLPGLWDMHAHVSENDGLLNLAAGVTTVRDLANDIDSLLARRKRIEDGQEIGTRIVLAGVIDSPGPYQGPTKVLVSTDDQARAAVDNYARLGYVQIKIYSSVKPELVPIIIQEAHQLGLRVSGHIPAEMTAAQCVELGYDEIQHVNFLTLNFTPEVKNTNTSARLTEPAKSAADLDLNSPQVLAFVKLLQDHHTVLDPTLSIFEDMYDSSAGKIPRGFQPIAGRLPPQVRRGLMSSALTPPPGMEARYRQSFQKMMALVGMMYRAGIPIEDGTDSMPGFALHRELELDVQLGIPANRVLQDATLNAAHIMKLDADLGSIAPGKLADLTLVDGDPTTNISDVRKTALVVKDGVLYKPAELYAALGVAP
ncbi:MAG: amidohydrolase family protein [Candidatus Acidiferrales bacterium]